MSLHYETMGPFSCEAVSAVTDQAFDLTKPPRAHKCEEGMGRAKNRKIVSGRRLIQNKVLSAISRWFEIGNLRFGKYRPVQSRTMQ